METKLLFPGGQRRRKWVRESGEGDGTGGGVVCGVRCWNSETRDSSPHPQPFLPLHRVEDPEPVGTQFYWGTASQGVGRRRSRRGGGRRSESGQGGRGGWCNGRLMRVIW